MVQAAAIYCRISADREGRQLGVTRQRDDCLALAEARGWRVAEVYVDNDVSAYSGKPRPEYRRMLRDLKDGSRDAVVVY
ncbi:MAG: recombinase family protein, partial [Actinomycetota bacterium]